MQFEPRERGISPCGPATVMDRNLHYDTATSGKSQVLKKPKPGDLTQMILRKAYGV